MKPLEMMAAAKTKTTFTELAKSRARKFLRLLKKYYPDAECSLFFKSPYQLLVATTLSAQCTDDRVNQVVPHLFKKFPDPFQMSKAKISEIEEIIRSTGFYKNKAKSLLKCAKQLVSDYGGEVPQKMDDLIQLGGVGRKTANVVLGNAFGVPGLVVDTHVTRLSNRMGLANGKDAVKLERELQKVIPKKDWTIFAHLMISHGRAVCKARKPQCGHCFLESECPKIGV